MGSFAEAFGMGSNMYNAMLERQRQAKLDDIAAKDADLRQGLAKTQLNSAQIAERDAAALRDASKPVAPTEEFSSDVSGKTPEEVQAIAERMSTGEFTAPEDSSPTQQDDKQPSTSEDGSEQPSAASPAVSYPEVKSSFNVAGKSYADQASGLAAAAAYNSPEAKAQRYADTLSSQGKQQEALDYMTKFRAAVATENLQKRQAVANLGLQAINSGGPQALVDMYNQHYNDGLTAKLIPDPANPGGGSIVRVDAKGDQAGSPIAFKNADELAQGFYYHMLPEERLKMQQAIATKTAETQATQHVLRPGDKIGSIQSGVTDNTAPPKGYEDVTDPVTGQTHRVAIARPNTAAVKADHFNEKEWDAAAKVPEKVITLDDVGNGKPGEDLSLRSAYQTTFNQARVSGQYSPNEAANRATDAVALLKQKAQAMVDDAQAKDKKSTLTLQQASAKILATLKASAPQQARTPTTAAVTKAQPGDSDKAMILRSELAKARSTLSSATDEASKNRAQGDINALLGEMKRYGVSDTVYASQPSQPTVNAAAKPQPASAPQEKPASTPTQQASPIAQYTPPVGSPAGIAAAKREAVRQQNIAAQNKAASERSAAASQLASQAKSVLAIQDPTERAIAAQKIQDSPSFGLMDQQSKAAISLAVNGR